MLAGDAPQLVIARAVAATEVADALNVWITSRTVSSSAAANRVIAGTSVPDADAMMIIARRAGSGAWSRRE